MNNQIIINSVNEYGFNKTESHINNLYFSNMLNDKQAQKLVSDLTALYFETYKTKKLFLIF